MRHLLLVLRDRLPLAEYNRGTTTATGTSVQKKKLLHQAAHTPKFWKIVDTNSEFTLSSFHSVFGHAKHITHLDFRYSQRQLGCRNLIENALNDCVNLVHLDLGYNTSIFTLYFIQSVQFLRYLDITSCQNGEKISLTLSLNTWEGCRL